MTMRPRPATAEDGFGLIELLIALTLLSIALLALVAAYSSSYLAIDRASRTDNAGVLANTQMEHYRAETWAAIGSYSNPHTVGSDGRIYDVEATVSTPNAPGTTRAIKAVTIIVSDATGRVWAKEETNFDQLSGS